ncbi:MAG: hypothetical protein IJ808_01825 [Muribaculaceae bacterium]|nr:hypothetical protein [Muribaculaceae bacterium]
MKKISLLLILLVALFAQNSYGKDLLLLGKMVNENDQEVEKSAYLSIELTDVQPDPDLYTLPGKYFVKVKISGLQKKDVFYFDVFFNESKAVDHSGRITLENGAYEDTDFMISRAPAGHFVVATHEKGADKYRLYVFPAENSAADEFMPFLQNAIEQTGMKFWR